MPRGCRDHRQTTIDKRLTRSTLEEVPDRTIEDVTQGRQGGKADGLTSVVFQHRQIGNRDVDFVRERLERHTSALQ